MTNTLTSTDIWKMKHLYNKKFLNNLGFDYEYEYQDSLLPYYSKIVKAKNDEDKIALTEYLIKIYDEEIKYSDEFIESMHRVINRRKKQYSCFTIWIEKFIEKYLYWM